MSDRCRHDHLVQISTLAARTDWTRGANGFHEPDEAISKVLGEETEWFECEECGEQLWPDLAP